jgi:hypothetical protein
MQMFTVFYYNTSIDIAKFVNKNRYYCIAPADECAVILQHVFNTLQISTLRPENTPKIPRR